MGVCSSKEKIKINKKPKKQKHSQTQPKIQDTPEPIENNKVVQQQKPIINNTLKPISAFDEQFRKQDCSCDRCCKQSVTQN